MIHMLYEYYNWILESTSMSQAFGWGGGGRATFRPQYQPKYHSTFFPGENPVACIFFGSKI